MAEVSVIYTMWSNLKKTPGMKPGEVTFHIPSIVSFKLVISFEDKVFLKTITLI